MPDGRWLHRCEASLDTFADQQHLAGIAKTGDTVTKATIAGQWPPEGCLSAQLKRRRGLGDKPCR